MARRLGQRLLFLFLLLLISLSFFWYFTTRRTVRLRYERETLLQKLIELKWLKDRVETQEELLRSLKRTTFQQSDLMRESRKAFSLLPRSSDVYCQGDSQKSRTCRIRNLCLATHENRFFILKGASSMFVNVPKNDEAMPLLDLTTVDGHNVFVWRYDDGPADFFTRRPHRWRVSVVDVGSSGAGFGIPVRHPVGSFKGILSGDPRDFSTNVTIVKGRTYLTKRFYPVNIMHVFHDDWLGLYALRDLWPSLVDPFDEYYYQDDDDVPLKSHNASAGGKVRVGRRKKKQHALTVFEHHPQRPYDLVYDWLGNFQRIEPLLGWSSWNATSRPEAYVCFQDAVVGNDKSLSWYQYGYGKPQGPIPGHPSTGWKLREAAMYMLRQLQLSTWDPVVQPRILKLILDQVRPIPREYVDRGACIAVFSRRSTRLILNEPELQRTLEATFGLPVCWMRLEENTIPQLIATLRSAVLAFGMHGSLLVLCMFLPPGAVLVEGYPYGVPAENYTPYREMARLPGMHLAYRAWTAPSSTDCVGHAERAPSQGGLKNLNDTYRQFILNSTTIPLHHCCDNPHWLYRIFQDTRVNVSQIVALLADGARESYAQLPMDWKRQAGVEP